GVFQFHFRGASVHGDLRFATGEDFLTGWTMALQIAGSVPKVETVGEARRIARQFSMTGSPVNKGFVAPARIYATPKSVMPVKWLDITGEVFKPGEIGATSEETGVMV